eukprot:CAMPEP_0170753926 /NCGR_PEP_ID=MMETSP0437-20130122/12741_1 /TAXON_ID=0 /ORGANISM="Sexangularia sp." /LENGTH=489 /DNA_ID=CAMNT_0011093053 /DNA_START=37 /DNA_END=1506 /DNA_ORIENTATION=+
MSGFTAPLKAEDFKNGDLPDAPGPRDVPWAALFCLQILIVLALAGAGFPAMSSASDDYEIACISGGASNMTIDGLTPAPSTPSTDGGSPISGEDMGKIFGILAIEIVLGGLAAALWLWIAQRYPKQLIIGSIVTWVALLMLFGVMLMFVVAVIGVFFLIAGVLSILIYYLWRKRIPFASALLSTCATVTRKWPAMISIPYYGIFMLFVWVIVWGVHAIVWFIKMNLDYNTYICQNGTSEGYSDLSTVFYIWSAFSYYWAANVVSNVVHVTLCGVFATWYFLGGDNNAIPKNPTSKALRRSLTTSFGSICLGSLLVAILQTIKTIVRSFRSRSNPILYFVVMCLLNCIESLIRYFNKYAFVQVAVYGMSFCDAAKATVDLLKTNGFDALINDYILDKVLFLGGLVGGVLVGAAGFGLGYAMFTDLGVAAVFALLGLFVGYGVMMNAMRVIESGVATILVCFICDPESLRRNDEELHNLFVSTYNFGANGE